MNFAKKLIYDEENKMDFYAESVNINSTYSIHQPHRLNDQHKRQKQQQSEDKKESDERSADTVDISQPEIDNNNTATTNPTTKEFDRDADHHSINILIE